VIYSKRYVHIFISVVSIPPVEFDHLLVHFDRHYIIKSGPGRRGHPPRIVYKHAVLALVLHFYTHAIEHKTFCQLFAIVPSTFSRVLKNAEVVLGKVLVEISDAAVYGHLLSYNNGGQR
jgi:hypothetical protein